MSDERQCCICRAPLSACMGFVLARDIVQRVPKPRELCGRCVEVTNPIDIP